MDTYDIFKKLTKGLTFKQRVLGVSNYENKSEAKDVKKEDIKVKEEVVSESDDEESVDDLYEHSEPESDNHSDDEQLQLVEGVEVPGKKKKKKNKKEKPADLAKKLELEEHNRFRNEHGIKCVGRHVPAALKDFDDLMLRYKVSEELVKTVRQCGYSEPTPVQRQAVPCMLEDRQILACAPTGSGKTAAFILPLLHSLGAPQGGPRALILCPTRELAHQIYREALRLSESVQLRISVLHNLKESKVKEREATFKKSDIVITTPNRLCYLLNQENLGITLEKVRWLIIDEADKLFEGSTDQENEFRQQLEQILTSCAHKERRVAMFSATHTPAVAKWCRHQMKGLINITVGQRNAATNLVDQELLFCGNESGKLVAFRQLVQKGLKPPVLVFVQSKDRARQLFKELIYDGVNVDVIHADRTQAQRDNVVRSFRVGRIWVLICTELMGRGIDFRGVNLVVNYDFPPSAISYIHRIGRAGRAGTRGNAITFFTQDDVVNLRSIASVMKQSGCAVPDFMLAIKQDHNKRKRLLTHAPHRDRISTVLEKKADKRKLEADKILEKDKNDNKKNHKNAKRRKIQNGDTSEDFIKVKKNKNGKKDRKFVANKKHINGKVPNGAKNNKKGKKNGAPNKKVK